MDEPATIAEMMEALLVFDEGLLNSRYHGMLQRYPESGLRDALVRLPGLVLKAGRHTRSGAEKWMRGPAHALDHEFLEWGERTLLDSFLSLTESEMRLIAYAGRAAPTADVRADFEEAVQAHRIIAKTLREALALLARDLPDKALRGGVRGVQEEEDGGNLFGQLEDAVRTSTKSGHAVRSITLSHTALRHLRDQGAFRNGESTFMGTPVVVDFGWDASGFALHTFDAVPLEEIMGQGASTDDSLAAHASRR